VKLKRLYIGDMGIYRNALMENINSKIVVVGGLNRAGKTTFLEVMRHLAYGFPKGLREAVSEYYVEGDFTVEDNREYFVKLSGLKEPQVTPKPADEGAPLKALYGNVDRYTYSQLYSITLDELKRSNVKSEEEKLQSVLLGAGLKDIVHLPKLIEEFRKEKEKLGGKLGNPNTRLFKPYYDKLLEGIEGREEALKQLDEYEKKCQELKELENQIENCSSELADFNEAAAALEAAKSYYNKYRERKHIELQIEALKHKNILNSSEGLPFLERIEALKEEYEELSNQYERLKKDFDSKVSSDKSIYKGLLSNREPIISYQKRLSGIMERIENHRALKENCQRRMEQLQTKMNSVNIAWRGDFLKVININCDSIEQDELMRLVDKLNDSEADRKQSERELQDLKLQKEMLEKEIKSLKTIDTGIFIKKYLYISLSILFAGAMLFIISKPLGGALALVGAVAASLYFIMKYSSETQLQARKSSLKLQKNALENKIQQQEKGFSKTIDNINALKTELDGYKNKLEIYKEVSPMGLLQYFKEVRELKKEIMELGYNRKNLEKLQQDLEAELMEASQLVKSFEGKDLPEEQDMLKCSRELCNKLEELSQQLVHAEKLSECEAKYYQFEKRIRTLLNIPYADVLLEELYNLIEQYGNYNQYKLLRERMEAIETQLKQIIKGERINRAFEYIFKEYNISEGDGLLSLLKLFQGFSSEDQLGREYDIRSAGAKEASEKLESLKERRQNLSSEIKAIGASEKLIYSQRIIDGQRAALKQLAVKFSAYSAAEFILDSVQKSFIKTAKDTILGGAGNIFNKITGGEYKALLPGDNLLQTDFKAMLQDGKVQDTIGILSRGTGEQLFLSVRLNRIMEMKEKLPIVLDDPFVNFDSCHIKNTLKVISELAENNQVFILTCHSELVKLIHEAAGTQVQYWKLARGSFQPSDCHELAHYLL
jgi:uncharacterized protein YhaN